MIIVICTILLPTCSVTLCIFGFIVGRCARKIPILDNNLPRAIHRGQLPANSASVIKEAETGKACCPKDLSS